MKFKVEYPSGVVEDEERSDCDSLDAYINSKFGISAEAVAEHGVKVTVVVEGEAEQPAEQLAAEGEQDQSAEG